MFELIVVRVKKLGLSFMLTVCVPVSIAILYYGVFASDIYLSETQFIVRSPGKQAPSGLGILLQSTGIGSSAEELSAAQNYVVSRDALSALNKDHSITKMFSRSDISVFDRFNPTGTITSLDDLYRYFKKHLLVQHQTASNLHHHTIPA